MPRKKGSTNKPKIKSKFEVISANKFSCPVHKEQEASLYINDGNREKTFCLACVIDGFVELGCFEVKKLT